MLCLGLLWKLKKNALLGIVLEVEEECFAYDCFGSLTSQRGCGWGGAWYSSESGYPGGSFTLLTVFLMDDYISASATLSF